MSEEKKPVALATVERELANDGEDEHTEQELRLIAAQAQANVSVIREAATQLKAVADSPGVQELLKGAGQRLVAGNPEVLARTKNEHERAMQADRLQAEQSRRRDLLGVALLGTAALVIVAVIAAVSVLAAKGIITPERATAIAAVLIALVTAFGVGRKTKPDK